MPINEGAQPRRANEEQGKPGTNEEQRGPTANGEQRQPREQAPSGAARPGGAARRWAATAGQWSATALRLGARWLHSVPATRAVAAALLVGVGVCLAWSGAFPLGSASADPSHWWSLVTAPFVFPRTSMETVLLIVLALIVLGGMAEHRVGSRRWLAAALVAPAAAVATTWLLAPLIQSFLPEWGASLDRGSIWGAGPMIVGLAGPVIESLGRAWRWRARFLLIGVLALSAGVIGSMDTFARLWAGVYGLVIGRIAYRGRRQEDASTHDIVIHRQIVSLTVVCWTVAAALTIFSTTLRGPLAEMRWSVAPGWWMLGRASVGSTLLALMPVLLQLVLAYGLRRGRRFAMIGTLVLQGCLALSSAVGALVMEIAATRELRYLADDTSASVITNTTQFLLVPVTLNLLLCAVVAWSRKAFTLRSRPGTVRALAARWATMMCVVAAISIGLGMLASDSYLPLVLDQGTADIEIPSASVLAILHDYLLALLPTSTVSIFEPSLEPFTLLAEVPVVWTPLVAWALSLALVARTLVTPAHTRQGSASRLVELIRAGGGGTLAWMMTWKGNSVWIREDDRAGVAYRPGGGTALTVTDPVCPSSQISATIEEFADFASRSGLTPALYSVHEPVAGAARELGWTVMQVAEESLLDLPGLAFKGKAYQDVRTAMNHAKREGVEAVWTTWEDCPQGRRDQIESISRAWSADKALPEMGFTLGGLDELRDPATRLLLAIDSDGTVQAVTSWLPVHRQGEVVGLTLDVMRRRKDGWRPAIDFLIARAALSAQEEGLEVLSLSGAPLARSQEDDSGFGPMLDVLASILEPLYGFASLHSFKRKFKPRREALYLAVPDASSLGTVGAAIGHAYVPNMTAAQTARLAGSVAGGVAAAAIKDNQ